MKGERLSRIRQLTVRWRPIALVPVTLLGVGCAGHRSKPPLFGGSPEFVVTMREYEFDYSHGIPSGQVIFRFVNAGKAGHAPILQPLDEDLPPIDEQLHGPNRVAVQPFASILPRQPGQTSTIVVQLVPNQRYAFICTASDSGQSHALRGMNSEFRTPPGDG